MGGGIVVGLDLGEAGIAVTAGVTDDPEPSVMPVLRGKLTSRTLSPVDPQSSGSPLQLTVDPSLKVMRPDEPKYQLPVRRSHRTMRSSAWPWVQVTCHQSPGTQLFTAQVALLALVLPVAPSAAYGGAKALLYWRLAV